MAVRHMHDMMKIRTEGCCHCPSSVSLVVLADLGKQWKQAALPPVRSCLIWSREYGKKKNKTRCLWALSETVEISVSHEIRRLVSQQTWGCNPGPSGQAIDWQINQQVRREMGTMKKPWLTLMNSHTSWPSTWTLGTESALGI